MMISPNAYIDQFKNYSYEDLLKIRDEMYESIKAFEKGKIDPKAYMIKPSPDTIYQMNLEYLAEICKLIHEKYNRKINPEEDEEEE